MTSVKNEQNWFIDGRPTIPASRRSQRSEAIDCARGLMVVLVLVLHTSDYIGYNLSIKIMQSVLTPIRMPLLMLISGALTGELSSEKRRRRVAQLAWLTLCWTPLMFLARRAGGLSGEHDWWMEFIIPSTEAWYLWALTLLTAADPLLRRMPFPVVLVLAYLARFAALHQVLPEQVYGSPAIGWHQTLAYSIFFLIGSRTAACVHGLTENTRPLLPIGLAMATIVLWTIDEDFLYSLSSAAAALSACPFVLRYLPLSRTGASIGRRTLPVYLGHAVLLRPFSPFLFGMHGPLALAIAAMLLPASLLLHKSCKAIGLSFLYRPPEFAKVISRFSGALSSKLPPSNSFVPIERSLRDRRVRPAVRHVGADRRRACPSRHRVGVPTAITAKRA